MENLAGFLGQSLRNFILFGVVRYFMDVFIIVTWANQGFQRMGKTHFLKKKFANLLKKIIERQHQVFTVLAIFVVVAGQNRSPKKRQRVKKPNRNRFYHVSIP